MEDDAIQLRNYAEQGAEEALTRLVHRHLPLVFSVALRRVGGDRQLAQEVAQSVFVDVARKAARLAQLGNLAPWLYTATHFAAAKAVRADHRRRKHEQEAQRMHDLNDEPPHDAAWAAIRPFLDDAMVRLKPVERDAVVLRFFDGRGFGEIGATLGLSESGARMRVERALDKLRAELQRRGVTSALTVLGTVLTTHAVAAPPAGMATAVATAALTGTAAGGSAFTLLNLMAMTKIQIGVAAGIVLTGAGVVGIEHQEQRALREAIRTAESRPAEAESLQAEITRLEQVVAERSARRNVAVAETAALRAELAKLERDVQLRTASRTQSRNAARSSGTAPLIFELNELDGRPVALERTAPTYPGVLKHAGLSGQVDLVMVLDENGAVLEVETLDATHPEFAVAAMEAVLDWRFQPGVKEGTAVATRVRQRLDFTVDTSRWF